MPSAGMSHQEGRTSEAFELPPKVAALLAELRTMREADPRQKAVVNVPPLAAMPCFTCLVVARRSGAPFSFTLLNSNRQGEKGRKKPWSRGAFPFLPLLP